MPVGRGENRTRQERQPFSGNDLRARGSSVVTPTLAAESPVLPSPHDGVLYSLPSQAMPNAGHLLSIDPATASGMDLGDTGVSGLVALTIPEPSTLALLGLAGLLTCARRRMA